MLASLALLVNCARPPGLPVLDPSGTQDFSRFQLTSLKGTRDGDRLNALALYSDGARSISVTLQFKVGPQTHLDSGQWQEGGASGEVRERSVTFLGGQSGPPSLGGRFDLVSPTNQAVYRIHIPLQPLTQPL